MLEIASDQSQKGVFQKDIAEKQKISVKYLDQIVCALKAKGLIINVRGKKSGYRLTRQPSEITMLDIHNAFEPGICVVDCMAGPYHCELERGCRAHGFWGKLNNIIVNYFTSVTLQNLLDNEELAGRSEKENSGYL